MFLRKWKSVLAVALSTVALLSLGAKCRVVKEDGGKWVDVEKRICDCTEEGGTECMCRTLIIGQAIWTADALALASDSPSALAPDELSLE
jgi:hypothetical protein